MKWFLARALYGDVHHCVLQFEFTLDDIHSRSQGHNKAKSSVLIVLQTFQSVWMEFDLRMNLIPILISHDYCSRKITSRQKETLRCVWHVFCDYEPIFFILVSIELSRTAKLLYWSLCRVLKQAGFCLVYGWAFYLLTSFFVAIVFV